jgi:hypothetical protein
MLMVYRVELVVSSSYPNYRLSRNAVYSLSYGDWAYRPTLYDLTAYGLGRLTSEGGIPTTRNS